MRWLALVVVACHASPPPVRGWTAPTTGAYRPSDAFHVAAADTVATWTNPPSFYPCPLEGATFLCGTSRVLAVRGERIEPDAALERGRALGIIETITGRWPDDAWIVVRTESAPLSSCGRCHFVVQRWRGDHWERVAERAGLIEYPRWITAWRGALFAVDDDPPHRELVAFGAASPIVEGSRCAVWPQIAATPSMFVVVGTTCGGSANDVTRWTDRGPVVDHPIADTAELEAVATPRGPAIFGGTYTGDPETGRSILLRFDGDRWVSREAPGHAVQSYVVAPDGTEWALIDDGLLAREPDGTWQRVDGWRAEALRYGRTQTAWAERLWVAEGSVWLGATVEGGCANTKGCEYRSVLLRTGPPAPPVMLRRDRGV